MARMNYTAKDIKSIFKVSHQTVQNWSKTFAEYLSPTARPESGRMRLFTEDDLRVFSLAQAMTGQGANYDDVLAALGNGSRGELPEASSNEIALPMNTQVLALRDSLNAAHNEIKRLQSDNDHLRGQNSLLERQMSELQAKVDRLNREIGKLEG